MLTIYASTFCRPDYIQLLAHAIQRTLAEPYRFVVYVHPNGLVREWQGVDEVVSGTRAGFNAIDEILQSLTGPSVVIHDDMIPVMPWSQESFPAPHVCRFGGHTLNYHADGFSKPAPVLRARRIWQPHECPDGWPQQLKEAAAAARVEVMLGGIFLHIDKGTTAHPLSPLNSEKPRLVSAICEHLSCDLPLPLSDGELAVHPGRLGDPPVSPPPLPHRVANFAVSAASHIAAGMPQASDEEVARRFTICETCEHFDGKACRKCGCPVVREKKFLSKLSWAKERCPVGKWGPVSS